MQQDGLRVQGTLYYNSCSVVITHLRSSQGKRRSGWYRSRRDRSRCTIWAIDTDSLNTLALRASGQPRGEDWDGFYGEHQECYAELEEREGLFESACDVGIRSCGLR